MSQPKNRTVLSKKKQHVIEINQSTQSMVSALLSQCYLTMAEYNQFSISNDLFSNSNENERFPMLSEEALDNLGSKNQNQNTSKITNLAERKCSVAKRESWKIFLAMSYVDAILCRFLLKFEKKTVTNTNQIVERRMPDSRSYKARSDTLFTTFIDRCSIFTL